ncbi:MAG: excinuclease ABC subunit UvrA [Defluviitaleaceae bacterium]|nr:excinuclease ABC subunit UvrA [Defluviitaleaceae bacterium]
MSQEYIELTGLRENNLKNISLRLPKRKITIFTGVSGSGKSSVVFETIAQESARLLNETLPAFVRGFLPKYSRPDADSILNISPSIIIDQKRIGGNSRSTLGTITDIDPLLRILFSRVGKPYVGGRGCFSFNDTVGMCGDCQGIGRSVALNLDTAIDADKSLNDGAIKLPGYGVGTWLWKFYAHSKFFDCDKKISDYTPDEYHKLVYAKPEKIHLESLDDLNTTYEGLAERFERTNIRGGGEKSEKTQAKLQAFTRTEPCRTCGGKRYSRAVLSCKIDGRCIADMTAMQVDELIRTISALNIPEAAAVTLSLVQRLQDLVDIGLDYVSLNRETATLSGGESQRVKMVKNLSSGLTDMLYIFDEPSIGLHPRDVHRLNGILTKLRDKGNTVIVVEHDPDVIKIADFVVDMGPQAGSQGGTIMYAGEYAGLAPSGTLTARHLDAPLPIKMSPRGFDPAESFVTKPSSVNNLRNVSVRIPRGVFTVVTGVAGSGKSSLIHQVFAKEHPEAVIIDQGAVSANSRSNPATYTGIMDHIRQEFAEATGANASLFSFNSEGACEVCHGLGYIETDLSYMDTVKNVCEECGGKRFKREVLELTLRGKSIADVMLLTVADASAFFTRKEIRTKLRSIGEVGLGYLTLGQPLNTLSGGECQRIKLAKELNKKGNIYIMDEPTTGLHFSDISNILAIIDTLVNKGNTVVTIEHNLDIIRSADWIIDMGPGAGVHGGEILFEGTPAGLSACERSLTGRFI